MRRKNSQLMECPVSAVNRKLPDTSDASGSLVSDYFASIATQPLAFCFKRSRNHPSRATHGENPKLSFDRLALVPKVIAVTGERSAPHRYLASAGSALNTYRRLRASEELPAPAP